MKLKYHSVIEKSFFALLPVQIVMIMVSSLNSIIDGVIASNYVSVTALAVIALFLPVVKTLETINTIFLGGSQILCGQYIGKNQLKKSIGVFSTGMVFIFLVGLAATLGCSLFSGALARVFVRDEQIALELKHYIQGFSLGIIPMMLAPQLTSFLQMERQEKRTYAGMAAMIILNIALDIVFVSVFNLGMLGLGLATTVGNFAFFLILLSHYIFHDSVIRFDIHEFHPGDLLTIVQVGFPGAINQLGQTVRSLLLNTIMLTFIGNDGISAFSAVYTFGGVYWAVSGGVTAAVRVLSSIYVGEEDRAGLHTILKTALTKGLALVCVVTALCVACAPLFTGIFYGPEAGAVYRMTLAGFLIFPLCMPFSCVCCTFSNYYQCLKRMKIVNVLVLVDGVIGVILFSLLLTPVLGMNGIWIAHVASGVLTVLIVWLYTRFHNRHAPATIEELLVLDDSFGVKPEDRIDIQIEDMQDVINLSEGIVSFSRAHNIDRRRSMMAGLCVEEMAGNIVAHGFDGRKAYNIDARVVYKEDTLLIRIKDNCRLFNPKEVQDLFDPEDITHNIGLRIVEGTAENMSYNNCLGINVLNITI